MLKQSRELWLALFAILFITLIYLFMTAVTGGIPAAFGLYGHSIGVLGFILMLMTESLYSIRKRSHSARWGQMSSWLEFHIFTGLVGPYMVLLHTSWKFNGVAGVLMLLTVVIVISGFIGRYIYTGVPRTADGVELQTSELEVMIKELEVQLQSSRVTEQTTEEQPLVLSAALEGADGAASSVSISALPIDEQARQLDVLTKRRDQTRRQMAGLASARRWLAIWHAVHIPIGLTLFCLAFVHVIAAIYFADLLK